MKRSLLALFLLVGFLHADALFNFNGDTVGTVSPVDTNSGLTATFGANNVGSAPVVVNGANYIPTTPGILLSGNELAIDGGYGTLITFSQNIDYLSFDFGVLSSNHPGDAAIEIEIFSDGTFMGAGASPTTASFAELGGYAEMSVGSSWVASGGSFNTVIIADQLLGSSALLDNFDATLAPVSTPEPSSLSLFGAASLLIGLGAWRFKKQQAV